MTKRRPSRDRQPFTPNYDPPKLGLPTFTFDRVGLSSTVPKARLRQKLPVKALRRHCHSFNVLDDTNQFSGYRSAVEFTYSPSSKFWNLLLNHEEELATYKFSSLELAFDFHVCDERSASNMCQNVGWEFRKLWHQRRELRYQCDEFPHPPAGIIPGPTFYLEDRQSRTNVKLYCRYPKTVDGFRSDRPMFRVEWTLRGSDAIMEKTGIEGIGDLRGYYSTPFLEKHFRLERLHEERFGRWLDPRTKDPCYAFSVFLRVQGYRGEEAGEDWVFASLKWISPAHLRGWLRSERERVRHKRGRLTVQDRRFRALTDYKINTFFYDVTPDFDDT